MILVPLSFTVKRLRSKAFHTRLSVPFSEFLTLIPMTQSLKGEKGRPSSMEGRCINNRFPAGAQSLFGKHV